MQHTIFVSIQIYNYTIADMCIMMCRMIKIEYTLHDRNTYTISGLNITLGINYLILPCYIIISTV